MLDRVDQKFPSPHHILALKTHHSPSLTLSSSHPIRMVVSPNGRCDETAHDKTTYCKLTRRRYVDQNEKNTLALNVNGGVSGGGFTNGLQYMEGKQRPI